MRGKNFGLRDLLYGFDCGSLGFDLWEFKEFIEREREKYGEREEKMRIGGVWGLEGSEGGVWRVSLLATLLYL